MQSHGKTIGIAFALIAVVLAGCTPPVYHHAYVTKYDADGKVIGYEETESITQQDPNTSSLKVRITKQDKLEK